MTLEKAIEIQTFMGQPNTSYHTEEIMAARKLGIEALKRLKVKRNLGIPLDQTPLPGETEEGE